jgi:hypothetical protein
MEARAVPAVRLDSRQDSEMSYKFQRLREKIRRAIESGELQGKLPGERALARRFHVNAKTLSKALTDLAAEGVLDRCIGRGTYVKGSSPTPSVAGKWLVLCDSSDENSCTMGYLQKACPELKAITSVTDIRPSFLNQFSAVIDLSASTPDAFLRDLLVRNIPVVSVNREPRTYSLHAVQMDVTLGASRLGRDLILAGHRRLGALEPRGSAVVAQALRQAAARYAPDAIVEAADPIEIEMLLDVGITAFVCGSVKGARQARSVLATRNVRIPEQVSLTAVGCSCPTAECSGHFVECEKIAQAVVGLLKDVPTRPVSLWLSGTWIDRGTLAPLNGRLEIDHALRAHIAVPPP